MATDGSAGANVTVVVTNVGAVAGDAVVLALLRPLSVPTQPGIKLLQTLVDFQRAPDVPAGGAATLTFALTAESLALADLASGDIVSAPGRYELTLCGGAERHEGRNVTVGVRIVGSQAVIEPFPTGRSDVH